MFRYVPTMVGPPKTLYDLRKIEASVQVTCRACGRVTVRDREALIADRAFQRLSMEWRAVQGSLPCPCCAKVDTAVTGLPFGESAPALRTYRSRMLLMNLALSVLDDAAQRCKVEDVATPALRLALRVLRPYLPGRDLLVQFWTEAGASRGRAYSNTHLALRWIVNALIEAGHPVWAEFR